MRQVLEASWLFPDALREGCARFLRARVLLARAARTWSVDILLRAPVPASSVVFVSVEEYQKIVFFWSSTQGC